MDNINSENKTCEDNIHLKNNHFNIDKNLNTIDNANIINKEKKKDFENKINSNNIHGKVILRNLIENNNKFKDLYLMVYPMNKKKEPKNSNENFNLNLGIDLFRLKLTKTNNFLKNRKVIKIFKEMKITDEEKNKFDYNNISKSKCYLTKSEEKILNTKYLFKKNFSNYHSPIENYNNNYYKRKEKNIPVQKNLTNYTNDDKFYYNNNILNLTEKRNLKSNLSNFEIDSWIKKEKKNQNLNFYDKRKSEIKKLISYSKNLFPKNNSKNTLSNNNLNYFSKNLTNKKLESSLTKNSSRKKFFN